MGATWIRSVNVGVVVRKPPGEVWQPIRPRGKEFDVLAGMSRQDKGKVQWSRIPELPGIRAKLKLDNSEN